MSKVNPKNPDGIKRILIADDHYVLRQGLKQVLAQRFESVEFGEASNGDEALEMIRKAHWDVLLLDIVMEGRGGLDTMSEVRLAKPKMPVIVLSMYSEAIFAVRSLKLGAYAYIRKDSAGHELIQAVEAAFRGERYITSAVGKEMANKLRKDEGELPHEELSDREYQVFCLLGSGMTVKEVAAKFSLSDKTISTYRARILEKMNMNNNSQITHYVVTNGLSVGVALERPPLKFSDQ